MPRFIKPRSRRVYVITVPQLRPVKIGVTDDVPKRLGSLQTSHWVELGIYATFLCKEAEQLEERAHLLLEPYRIRGEWFDVDGPTAVSILLELQRNDVIYQPETWTRRASQLLLFA